MSPSVTVLTTVLSGVIVFVIGQLVQKLVVDPVAGFREWRGKIAYLLLHLQSKIANASNTDVDVQAEFKRHAASLMVAMHQIPAYRLTRRIFHLPSRDAVLMAAQQLNLLSYNVGPIGPSDKTAAAIENMQALRKIEELLKIKARYH
jgi:hypothetical protein